MNKGDLISLGKLSWIVLATENNKALLLSEKTLPVMRPYKNAEPRTSERFTYRWSDCDINQYLNNEFLFKYKLLSAPIISVPHETEATPFVTSETTNERVFLLSASEAEKYLPRSIDRTPYRRSSWWLRTPGLVDPYRTMYVDISGNIYEIGAQVEYFRRIRPAIWIVN